MRTKKEIRLVFGKFLQAKRKEKKLSQSQLKKLLGYEETSIFLSRIERGVAPFPPKRASKLAEILGVEESEILSMLNPWRPGSKGYFAYSFKAALRESPISKAELARRLKIGHQSYVNRIMNGDYVPAIKKVKQIAKALELDHVMTHALCNASCEDRIFVPEDVREYWLESAEDVGKRVAESLCEIARGER